MRVDIYIREAYTCMKKQYGDDKLLLFHTDEYFEAYYDDALKISLASGLRTLRTYIGTGPDHPLCHRRTLFLPNSIAGCRIVLLHTGAGIS
ncbi:hypothetical protein [Alistipes putredinis]|uniref:hypothetical protein n=1 Tax=Alistipes putredinis TaxID=28117 RepID=UPI003AB16421